MPSTVTYKMKTKNNNLYLRVARGHFATNHSHSNYYIDVAAQKSRLSEASAVAEELCRSYNYTTQVIDTILCLDGTEVIGTCLARELTQNNFMTLNEHGTIYVLTPEMTGASQIMFRDNVVPMIRGKHVLILAVSISSGYTAKLAVDAIKYYGGEVEGISAIFATKSECAGYPVSSVFNPNDLPDYFACPSHECPLCRRGEKIDALMNCYGYSKL